MTRTASARGRRGLTLIEVLLALAIMLLSLGALAQLVGIGADNALSARMATRGNRLAQAKMAEVEAGVVSVQSGGQGTFDDDPNWSWTVEPQQAGPPNLYQVTVTVSRTVNGKSFEVTLSQMVIDPAMMGSAAQAEQPSDTDIQGAQTATTTTTGGTGGTSP
jgi:prepilin-type N-terminal cleavage/methylation domain-containing protein